METKSPGSGWEGAANEAVSLRICRQVSVETPVTGERKLPEKPNYSSKRPEVERLCVTSASDARSQPHACLKNTNTTFLIERYSKGIEK